jgi:hypothetical protein
MHDKFIGCGMKMLLMHLNAEEASSPPNRDVALRLSESED